MVVRHVDFDCHVGLRLRFELAFGLVEPWTRGGGIPQGCPLSMMFIVAFVCPLVPVFAYSRGYRRQLYAGNLKCVASNSVLLFSAARFTARYVRVAGQEPALCKNVLLCTSREVRKEMRT